MNEPQRPAGRFLLALALLAVLAYLPALNIPLMEDDYPNLWQSLNYGSPGGFSNLFHDAIFRLRATSYWMMFVLWRVFHLAPLGYHAVSLALHIANVWLLYFVCRSWPVMQAAAFWSAAFFALAEGHQEAVMWFSAINELLLFFFGMAALICWIEAGRSSRERPAVEAAGAAMFALALLSKESAVILVPLFALTAPAGQWRRTALRLIPYAALAAVAVGSVLATRDYSFRFSDGSFSWNAPFWITWPRSYFRLLWIWGIAAAGVILAARSAILRRPAVLALAWMGMGLIPYSFLTYMTVVASRQTYLASAGLAMLVGVAMTWVASRSAKPVCAAVAVVILAHNVGYLWLRKRPQFLERAAPTEQLIAAARRTTAPIWIQCFPRNHYIAEEAVHMGAGYPPTNLVWSEEEASHRGAATKFCYQPPAGRPAP